MCHPAEILCQTKIESYVSQVTILNHYICKALCLQFSCLLCHLFLPLFMSDYYFVPNIFSQDFFLQAAKRVIFMGGFFMLPVQFCIKDSVLNVSSSVMFNSKTPEHSGHCNGQPQPGTAHFLLSFQGMNRYRSTNHSNVIWHNTE